MKLNRIENQWCLDQIDRLKQCIVTKDYIRDIGVKKASESYHVADQEILDICFSILLVQCGYQIPKTYWSAGDYVSLIDFITRGELEVSYDD